MNKKIIILVGVVIIVIAGGILLKQYFAPYSYTGEAPAQNGTPTDATIISIENFKFSPQLLTVPAGTKVVWRHNDAASHTIVSDEGIFESGTLTRGEEFSFVFSQPGNYDYHCGIHSSMKGKIIVQ